MPVHLTYCVELLYVLYASLLPIGRPYGTYSSSRLFPPTNITSLSGHNKFVGSLYSTAKSSLRDVFYIALFPSANITFLLEHTYISCWLILFYHQNFLRSDTIISLLFYQYPIPVLQPLYSTHPSTVSTGRICFFLYPPNPIGTYSKPIVSIEIEPFRHYGNAPS
jgi:hypothetical protein